MRAASWIGPLVMAAAIGAVSPAAASAQGDAVDVVIAAGTWAAERLPMGEVRVDPHRTGRDADQTLARRLAAALGAELGTVEEMRRCADRLDPSTCELGCDALLAVSTPRVEGYAAEVRVYAWHRRDDPRSPVGEVSWNVRLERTGGEWRVVGADRRP